MQPVTTLLIDNNRLFREGFKLLFRDSEFAIAAEATAPSEAWSALPAETPPRLVLVDAPQFGDVAEVVRSIRANFPEARLVVLTSTFSLTLLSQALEGGADGFQMKDASFEALKQSLRLVVLGETIFPTSLASALFGSQETETFRELSSARGMSLREFEILGVLLQGRSNKEIAKALGITEATVKVHLKSLLRKINCTNRTQAAIWAFHNGIAANGMGEARQAVASS